VAIHRCLIGAGAALALSCGAVVEARSQEPGSSPAPTARRTWPYIAVGAGPSQCSPSPVLHAAIGVERLLIEGLGFGGELGAVADSGLAYCGAGVASANLFYRFSNPKTAHWSPFVTGGASLLAAEGGGGGGNLGVGIARFTARRVGFRLEGKAHWFPGGNAFLVVRVGLSF
jgi:hypothetical protein